MNTKPMSTKTLFEAELKVKQKRGSVFKFRRNKIESLHKCPLPNLFLFYNDFPNLFLVDNDFGYGTVIQCKQCHNFYRASQCLGLPYWDHLRGIKLWWYLKKANPKERGTRRRRRVSK